MHNHYSQEKSIGLYATDTPKHIENASQSACDWVKSKIYCSIILKMLLLSFINYIIAWSEKCFKKL